MKRQIQNGAVSALQFSFVICHSHTMTTALSYSPRFRITVDAPHDPLLPFLWFLSSLSSLTFHAHTHFHILIFIFQFRSIKNAIEASNTPAPNLGNLLRDCITKFKNNDRYRNDVRFLKIWLLYVTLAPFLFMCKKLYCYC